MAKRRNSKSAQENYRVKTAQDAKNIALSYLAEIELDKAIVFGLL